VGLPYDAKYDAVGARVTQAIHHSCNSREILEHITHEGHRGHREKIGQRRGAVEHRDSIATPQRF
jgi:hypothetical protein